MLGKGTRSKSWQRNAKESKPWHGNAKQHKAMHGMAKQSKAKRSIAKQPKATHIIRHVLAYVGPQRARSPGNKMRGAMLKLGTLWDVPRQVEGKRRPLAEVAHDIEESMPKKTKKVLIVSVAKPATSSSKYRRVRVLRVMHM